MAGQRLISLEVGPTRQIMELWRGGPERFTFSVDGIEVFTVCSFRQGFRLLCGVADATANVPDGTTANRIRSSGKVQAQAFGCGLPN